MLSAVTGREQRHHLLWAVSWVKEQTGRCARSHKSVVIHTEWNTDGNLNQKLKKKFADNNDVDFSTMNGLQC